MFSTDDVSFDVVSHTYTLKDGTVLPSVTNILRFMNADIAEFANRDARDRAAERGKAIHEACLVFDYEGEVFADSEIFPYVSAYAEFISDYSPNWEGMEVPVVGSAFLSTDLYAGTIDRYGIIDGERYVIDIKTGSSRNYQYYIAQVAAYAHALCHSPLGKKVDNVAFLVLRPDGYSFKAFKYYGEESRFGLSTFTLCYKLHKRLKEGENHGKRKRNGGCSS